MGGGNHVLTFRAQGVGQSQITHGLSVDNQIDHRAALLQIGFRICQDSRTVRTGLLQHLPVTSLNRIALDPGRYTSAGNHAEILGRKKNRLVILPIIRQDSLAQRMLRILLCGRGQGIEPLFSPAGGERTDSCHLRSTLGQRAGLVKSDAFDRSQALQSIALPNQKTMLRSIADGSHNSSRRSQNQGAGTEDNENRDSTDNLPVDKPGNGCGGQGRNDDPGSPAVSQPYDFSLARVSRLHQTDHTLDRAVLANLCSFHFKSTKLIGRATGHLVACLLIHRKRFTGHNRLIDRSLSCQNHAVHRYRLTGKHADAISHLYLIRRDDLGAVRCQNPGCMRRQMHQPLDTGSGLRHCQLLQKTTQLHNHSHLARCENLSNTDRSNQRQRNQHIRLNIKSSSQSNHSLQDNRYPAKQNRNPGRIKRQPRQ